MRDTIAGGALAAGGRRAIASRESGGECAAGCGFAGRLDGESRREVEDTAVGGEVLADEVVEVRAVADGFAAGVLTEPPAAGQVCIEVAGEGRLEDRLHMPGWAIIAPTDEDVQMGGIAGDGVQVEALRVLRTNEHIDGRPLDLSIELHGGFGGPAAVAGGHPGVRRKDALAATDVASAMVGHP